MARGSRDLGSPEGGVSTALALGLVFALAVLSLWWLQAPPRTSDAYREKAAKQAEQLISHVQTARLWAEGVADDEVTDAAALVGLLEAERDAARTTSSFESIDPPGGEAELRARFSDYGSEVTSALSRLRIAALRDNWQQVADERNALAAIAERLDRFAVETLS